MLLVFIFPTVSLSEFSSKQFWTVLDEAYVQTDDHPDDSDKEEEDEDDDSDSFEGA